MSISHSRVSGLLARMELGASFSRAARCASIDFARSGLPHDFPGWATGRLSGTIWTDLDRLVAGCDNPMGFIAAQEIGISEHFEVGSLFASGATIFAPLRQRLPAGGQAALDVERRSDGAQGRPSLD